MGIGEGSSFGPNRRISNKTLDRAYLWFQRNESKLFAIDIISIAVLFFLHLSPSTFQFFIQENINAIQIAAIVLVSCIVLSVVWKGIVPIVLCILGIVLIHNSFILSYYSQS